MQKVVPMSEGILTLEDQAKLLGIDGPQEIYLHKEEPGICCGGSFEATREAWRNWTSCKCDHCKETK